MAGRIQQQSILPGKKEVTIYRGIDVRLACQLLRKPAAGVCTSWPPRLMSIIRADMEKEMATHSSVLAWRIPGTGKPDGLPSMGSHRVGHD